LHFARLALILKEAVFALQAQITPLGGPIMSKNCLWGIAFAATVGAGLLLTPGTSDAQRRGWGWGSGGYDPWGYHSGGRSSAGTAATVPNRQNYPAENLTDATAAGFVLLLPDANADVWFEDQKTQQKGNLRQYISGSMDPNSIYTFHVRARWMDNGSPVEQTRAIDARAGQQVVIDFTKARN
jgi:uncharacterized protein (TIGR03000 family)